MPIRRFAALVGACDVFVGNDAGPLHVAAAVGTPSVGVFGPSSPAIWFSYATAVGHVAVRPDVPSCCGRDFCTHAIPCLSTVAATTVAEAVARALATPKERLACR